MLTTRLATGALVGALAFGVVGCGGSGPATSDNSLGTTPTPAAPSSVATPAPTPTTPKADISGLPAAQILAKAQAAARAAQSVHVKGAMTEGSDRVRMDLRLAKTAGSGSIAINGDSISLIVIGRTAYLRMGDSFWRHQMKSKAEANAAIQLINGRWIKTTLDAKDWRDFAMFGSKTEFFDSLFKEAGPLRKTGRKTVNGVACVGLGDSEGTLWVDRATARPVRIEAAGKSATDAMDFTEYNQVTTPKAPAAAQTVDGDALGG